MIPWGQWLQKKIRRNSNCLRYWWMDEGWMKLRTQTHQISWSRRPMDGQVDGIESTDVSVSWI